MKRKNINTFVFLLIAILMIYARNSTAQIQSLAGPRIEVSILSAGETDDIINEQVGFNIDK